MNILWGDDASTPEFNRVVGEFVAVKIFGKPESFGPFTSMAVFDGRMLIAGVIYHNFERSRGVLEISGAASDKRWLTRQVLKEMYAYPFNQLGVQMVVQRGSERDRAQHRMLTAYGFDAVRIPRLRGRDEAEFIFTLTDDAWRANRFNKKEQRSG